MIEKFCYDTCKIYFTKKFSWRYRAETFFGSLISTRLVVSYGVGLFTTNLSLTVYVTVCTLHRYKLGVDFRQSKSCTHLQHTGKLKTFRGLSSVHSQIILEDYGVLLPVEMVLLYTLVLLPA
jgi:hypothetical protein